MLYRVIAYLELFEDMGITEKRQGKCRTVQRLLQDKMIRSGHGSLKRSDYLIAET